jgi:hypothetical protein|eukprot:COSAG01_NODE_7929_length_2988_cov_1.796816_4_plen_69_part_00
MIIGGGGALADWELVSGAQSSSSEEAAAAAAPEHDGGGESFMCVYWVAVPKALRARRVNRRPQRRRGG